MSELTRRRGEIFFQSTRSIQYTYEEVPEETTTQTEPSRNVQLQLPNFNQELYDQNNTLSDPNGSRTRVAGMKARRPRPLDDGAALEQVL